MPRFSLRRRASHKGTDDVGVVFGEDPFATAAPASPASSSPGLARSASTVNASFSKRVVGERIRQLNAGGEVKGRSRDSSQALKRYRAAVKSWKEGTTLDSHPPVSVDEDDGASDPEVGDAATAGETPVATTATHTEADASEADDSVGSLIATPIGDGDFDPEDRVMQMVSRQMSDSMMISDGNLSNDDLSSSKKRKLKKKKSLYSMVSQTSSSAVPAWSDDDATSVGGASTASNGSMPQVNGSSPHSSLTNLRRRPSALRDAISVSLMQQGISRKKPDEPARDLRNVANMGSTNAAAEGRRRTSASTSSTQDLAQPHMITVIEDSIEYSMRVSDGTRRVSAAPIDKLIELLTAAERIETDLEQTFLLTFRHVLTPLELLEKLVARFDDTTAGELSNVPGRAGVIQTRVMIFLSKWIRQNYFDFATSGGQNEAMMGPLNALREKCAARQLHALSATMDETLGRERVRYEAQLRDIVTHATRHGVNHTPEGRRSSFGSSAAAAASASASAGTLLSSARDDKAVGMWEAMHGALDGVRARALADQLALIHSELLHQIEPHEFIVFLTGSDSLWHAQINIMRTIDWFNTLSRWVAGMVLVAAAPADASPTAKDTKRLNAGAAKLIMKFVHVAQKSRQLHDYWGVFAIVSGLNHGALVRLKEVWTVVSGRTLRHLHELEGLVDPAHNFRCYRAELRRLHGRLPTIPLLSLYLQDLTFINEMASSRPINGLDSINMTKLFQLRYKIASFQYFRASQYSSLKSSPSLLARLYAIAPPSDNQLYDMSYAILPRLIKKYLSAAF